MVNEGERWTDGRLQHPGLISKRPRAHERQEEEQDKATLVLGIETNIDGT